MAGEGAGGGGGGHHNGDHQVTEITGGRVPEQCM
ncbi:hypothetical protein CCACVL1_14892 [Corchorus capsularis]|uniref:Uncharacterized protein n=1 Tax=Corchorus capsularis TaxID=210143 RepID=A0A1R3I544_COCAP|nr:hypothetical protein CCACVL1_14892 [Corchorus capsularis]